MMLLLCLTLLISPIINAEVLIYPVTLQYSKNYGVCFTIPMYFQDSQRNVKVSLGSSEFLIGLNKSQYEISDIKVRYDNHPYDYPDYPTSGYITKGIFNASLNGRDEVVLNVLYNKSFYYPKLGLARRVKYDNSDVEELYDLDFMSQLIKQGVIKKHYIYLTPFLDVEGNERDDISLELGRLPIYFTNKYYYSYTPLNKLYPTKWATKLSHIYVGHIREDDLHEINADVVFTDSNQRRSYFPETLKTILRTIFVDKLNCEFKEDDILCPNNKIEENKFYFIFNGYAHYIPNSILFYSRNETHKNCRFEFSSKIDYISIDSYIFGFYHRLYDGESDTIRFVYPDPNNPYFIEDVKEYTGYENRDGVKREIRTYEFLRDWERSLEKEESIINETKIEIKNDKKAIRERTEQLNKKENELKEREKQYNEIFEKMKKLEEENQELTEKINLDKELIWHLINYCNQTTHP